MLDIVSFPKNGCDSAKIQGRDRMVHCYFDYNDLENELVTLAKEIVVSRGLIGEDSQEFDFQLEDPKKAKGLVKRGLVRIVTPGTIIESSMLNEKENNFILALTSFGEEFTLACCDLSTGEFFTNKVDSQQQLMDTLKH